MKRKRLLCAILALVLLCAAQPAALAAAATGNKRSTDVKATSRLPVIQVTVPTRGTVYINPLKLPVSIGDWEANDQIVSTPNTLANHSEVPVSVDVEVTASVKSGSTMRLVSGPTGGVGTNKDAFIYFEMVQADSEYPEDAEWASGYDASKHIIVGDGIPTSKTGMVTLPARNLLDAEVAPGGYAPFRLAGDAVVEPDTPWNNKDGINVTIAFTFTPLSYPSD